MGTIFETAKGPGMKFVQRWFDQMVKRAWDRAARDQPGEIPMKLATVTRSSNFDSDNGLNIQVYQAIGGRIVSFRHYDRKTDRSTDRTYIIPEDQDFERELGKMITLESMR